MTRALGALVCLAALAGCGDGDAREEAYAPPPTAAADDGSRPDRGDFVLKLRRPRGDDRDAFLLLRDQEPQIIVDGLNESIALPRDVAVVFETGQDGEVGPYYDPSTTSIHVPYEFFYETYAVFLETGSREGRALDETIATVEFVIYHEVGHALADVLDLPITGREEDAVDGLAAAMLTTVVDQGAETVLTAADWFAALSALGAETIGAEEFADVHSLDDQRFFSLLCWVYGSDPDEYAFLVEDGDLPRGRALGCPEEFVQNVDAWLQLLEPWLKD